MAGMCKAGLALVLASLTLTLANTYAHRQDNVYDLFVDDIHKISDRIYKVCVGIMRPCLPWENDCCEGFHCTNYGGTFCVYDIQMCVCTSIRENEDID